jgi:hypothetical protein
VCPILDLSAPNDPYSKIVELGVPYEDSTVAKYVSSELAVNADQGMPVLSNIIST